MKTMMERLTRWMVKKFLVDYHIRKNPIRTPKAPAVQDEGNGGHA